MDPREAPAICARLRWEVGLLLRGEVASPAEGSEDEDVARAALMETGAEEDDPINVSEGRPAEVEVVRVAPRRSVAAWANEIDEDELAGAAPEELDRAEVFTTSARLVEGVSNTCRVDAECDAECDDEW